MIPFTAAMERRLDPGSAAPLALALSGGGDSLALLHLTMDWARERRRPVLALTVDHGLNPASAGWSVAAGAKARALGAGWRALTWGGPKPATGVQAKARAARHALLAEAARAAGARVLLMGHTADDVAEGEAMRQSDVPGLGRLREWSPSPAWPDGRGVFLLRPLLKVRRAELRTFLTERGADWLDDPANADPRFARVRARNALAGAVAYDATPIELDPAIPSFARRVSFTADHVGVTRANLDRASVAEAQAAASMAVLAAALLSISGTTRPPRRSELKRLISVIAARGVATLGGCRIDAVAETVHISREPARSGGRATTVESVDWVRNRFEAACGLYSSEAHLPPPEASANIAQAWDKALTSDT